MKYKIFVTPQFKKDIKYYRKKKKYLKITDDLDEVFSKLETGNLIGDEVPGLKLRENEKTFKVRVVNSSINVGKSSGFRLIYYVIKNNYEIYLLTIYSKKDKENISTTKIIELVNKYC